MFRSRRAVKGTKYIEVVMIVDNAEYAYYHGLDESTAIQKTEDRALEVSRLAHIFL